MSDLLAPTTFADFSHLLDPRLLSALASFKFLHPTLVQAKAIPLALEGKDILAKARTGSGKTGAYCIPTVQKILLKKASLELADSTRQATRALILVPTRELADQVTQVCNGLVADCDGEVSIANVAGGASTQLQRLLLSDRPDIIVATPSRALALLQSKALSLEHLETLTIDEADLILSYGHADDVKQIFSGGFMPKIYQSFLMSATMTKDVEVLKGMVLRNPAILRLEEDPASASSQLSQYYVKCSETDKFLLAYVLLKLRLIKGKCILFVNDVDRCYRLKLFLEQFGVKACVLNAELPLNSRFHIVQEFNKGVYDYIIATDEGGLGGEEEDASSSESESEEEEQMPAAKQPQFVSTQPARAPSPSAHDDSTAVEPTEEFIPSAAITNAAKRRASPSPPPPSSKRAKRVSQPKRDKEYGVSRGIDFVSVSCVLNFDLPTNARSYTHRVGRTARAHEAGLAISFVVPRADWGTDKAVSLRSARRDESVFERIKAEAGVQGEIKAWEWGGRKGEIEGFRYRMEDALRSVTRKAVKDARREELRKELLNSEKLKAHFALNPQDLSYLRHDAPSQSTRVQSHMKHVPNYLMPRIAAIPGASAAATSSSLADSSSTPADVIAGKESDLIVPFGKVGGRGRGRGRGGRGGARGGRGRGGGGPGMGPKKKDPLKTFK